MNLMAVKNKRTVARQSPAQQRETWLRALSAADDPRHVVPTLVVYRLLKLSNLISRPFLAANVAGMHPMNVSRAVAALRRHDRVCQRADPNNRRRKLLQLTPQGWALYRRLLPHVSEVAKEVFRDLTKNEIAQLSRLIDMMTARLEKLPIGAAVTNG
jgi:DNA-binding MarR family transcriptional regulator